MASMILPTARSWSNRVLAVCRDATALSFDLDSDATLGQLAEQVGTLANSHGGLSLPVRVRLAAGPAWALSPATAEGLFRRC